MLLHLNPEISNIFRYRTIVPDAHLSQSGVTKILILN